MKYIYQIELKDGTWFICKTKMKAIKRVISLYYRYKKRGIVSVYRFNDGTVLPTLLHKSSLKNFLRYEFNQLF